MARSTTKSCAQGFEHARHQWSTGHPDRRKYDPPSPKQGHEVDADVDVGADAEADVDEAVEVDVDEVEAEAEQGQ